jgi:CHAT domain-containing protein/tetratricopeptide (TPR) repeat protein
MNALLNSMRTKAESALPRQSDPFSRCPAFSATRRPTFLLTVTAILLVTIVVVIWRRGVHQSHQRTVMSALSKAYSQRRLIEARISGLSYAPLGDSRGILDADPHDRDLARAELTAFDDLAEHPCGESYHAVGQVYLAERKIELAVDNLKQAAAATYDDAEIENDLGAAYLEMARSLQGTEAATDLANSLGNLSAAIQHDKSLPEAVFNRALCYELLHLAREAEADWRLYLTKDSSSEWATEAGRHLETIEGSLPVDRKLLYAAFTGACLSNDDERAWRILTEARTRAGNGVIQRILDDYLVLADQGRWIEARRLLETARYAGNLEAEKVHDLFTQDVVRFYVSAGHPERESAARARSIMVTASERYRQSEYEESAKLYSAAAHIFERVEDSAEQAFAVNWVGNCYLRIPNAEQAVPLFSKLASLARRQGYKWLLQQALNSLGDSRSGENRFSDALSLANRSLEIAEDSEDPAGKFRNHLLKALIYQQTGDYSKSFDDIWRSLEVAQTFSADPQELWTAYFLAARNLDKFGFAPVAVRFLESTLDLANALGSPLLKSRSYGELATVYEELRSYANAVECGENGLAQASAIRGEKSRLNLVASSSLKLAELHREAGDFLGSLPYYDRAIEMHRSLNLEIYSFEAHRGKLLSLLGSGDDEGTAEEMRVVADLLQSYRPKLADESMRNRFFELAQSIYDVGIEFTYTRRNDGVLAFSYAEASRARSLLDLLYADRPVVARGMTSKEIRSRSIAQPLRIEQVQQQLPAGAQIIFYSVVADKVIIWVVSKSVAEARHYSIRMDEIASKVQSFVDVVTRGQAGSREDTDNSAKDLYSILIEPVENLLNVDDEVVIIPDKMLNWLPFGALISPKDRRYLVEARAFQVAHSCTAFVMGSAMASTKHTVSESILSVGDPAFDHRSEPGLLDLASAKVEAEAVARMYDAHQTLIDHEATRERLLKLLPKADVFHFAGHYVVDQRSPQQSGLLLAPRHSETGLTTDLEARLCGADIYNMKLARTRLAVLSGCRTGVEQALAGEGAIGAARAFLKAGVPLVVASLWLVDSDPSAQLMIKLHRLRKRGYRTVEALRLAQIEMINDAKADISRPRSWAGFEAIGGYATF